MSSLESAIALIEAERIDLYGRLKALDDALATLHRIKHDVDVLDHRPPRDMPRGKPRAAAAPDHPSPRGKPRATPKAKRPRRTFTDDQKRAGVELAERIGVTRAANELDVVPSVLRNWITNRELYGDVSAPAPDLAAVPDPDPEDEASPDHHHDDARPDPDAALELPATLRLVNKLGRRQCTCGHRIDTDDDWRRHNDRLRPHELADHRLEIVAADA